MKMRFVCKWYDLWIGAYWDAKKRRLYVLPVLCLGVCFDFGALDADEELKTQHSTLKTVKGVTS
jgi:hypothetical protein